MLFDQGLSVTGQREPVQNQGQEIMGNHGSQVPLELPQDQHLPVLEVGEEGGVSGLRWEGGKAEGSPSNLKVKTPVLLLGLETGPVQWGNLGQRKAGTFALSIYSSVTRCQSICCT